MHIISLSWPLFYCFSIFVAFARSIWSIGRGNASQGWKCLAPPPTHPPPHFDVLKCVWRAYGSMEEKKYKAERGRGSREKVVVCLGYVWKVCFSSILLIHAGPAWETVRLPEISSCYRRDPNCQFCVSTASLECAGSNQQIKGINHALLCRGVASVLTPAGMNEWWAQISRESKYFMSNNVISHLSLTNLPRIILCPMTKSCQVWYAGKIITTWIVANSVLCIK